MAEQMSADDELTLTLKALFGKVGGIAKTMTLDEQAQLLDMAVATRKRRKITEPQPGEAG